MNKLSRKRIIHSNFSNILLVVVLALWGLAGCDLFGGGNEEQTKPEPEPKIEGQYSQTDYNWYKGNLHASSYWTDENPGNHFPEMALEWYENRDYNFGVLADHNTLQKGDKSITIEKGTYGQKMLNQYLDEYGNEWVEQEEQGDSYQVRLKTLKQYRPKLEESGNFLVINSEEIDYRTNGQEGQLLHVNATNIQQAIQPPSGGGSTPEILQQMVDAVSAKAEEQDTPIIPHVNHPNTNWSITAEDLKQVDGLRFFEVYSGHPNARNSGGGGHLSTDEMWDEVNTHYLTNGKKRLFGLAVDDAHWYETDTDPPLPNTPGRGWIQVMSHELSQEAILASIQRGDFYSSTGVTLSGIQFDGETLSLTVDAEQGVSYTIQFIGTREGATDNPGEVLSESQGTEASYTFSGDELYVRAKVISDKPKENGSEDGEMEVAWVQPVVSNSSSGSE